MKHPLRRIFAPISMIVFVAAFMTAIVTIDTKDRLPIGAVTVATAITEADSLARITDSQRVSARP